MKRKILFASIALLSAVVSQAQLFSTTAGKVSFFSKTPLENIEAESKTVLSVMNVTTKEIAIMITNTSFSFPNKLMEEHFNEKYVESEKFPKSSFKGKINEAVDLSKDGEYKVTVTGKLNIHGVEKDRTIPGTIIVKDGLIQMLSNFKVKNVDHKIEIPTVVTAKISEEIDVMVDLKLAPKK
jgi:polyisoprenoid-binding protein YceI